MPSSGSLDAPRGRSAAIAAILLIAAAATFSIVVVGQRFWIDDSFISFRYARQLVEGNGLVYNAGARVEGYTNFLWTLVAAGGIALGFPALAFAQGIALLAQAGTLWALFQIGRATGLRGWRPLVAPLLLASSISFLTYPMSGMETTLFTFELTVAALLLVRRSYETRGGGLVLGLVLLSLPLTRFDGFVPVILLLSWPLLARRPRLDLRPFARPLVILVAGYAVYTAWRAWYYPTLLPNTFHAKMSFSVARVGDGLRYLADFVSGRGTLALALAAVPFLLRRTTPVARHLGWVVLGTGGYVAAVGGDWMAHDRFLLPAMPLLFALSQEGFALLASGVAPHLRSPRLAAAGTALLLLVLHAAAPVRAGLRFEEISGTFFEPHDAARIGRWLAEHHDPDVLMAVEWGGIIPYYVPNPVLDTWGLTDLDIAQRDFPKLVWGTKINPWYLAARGPELITPCARIMPTEQAAWESVRPGGANHYSHYPLMASAKIGYAWQVFQLGEDAWWPALVRRPDASPAGGSGE